VTATSCPSASSVLPATVAHSTAGYAADDDVEYCEDAIDDCVEDCTDGMGDCGESIANGAED